APATTLFSAWSDASRGLPLAAEVIQGSLCFDFHWWPELCQGNKGFLTIEDFMNATPSIGSELSSIQESAAGDCPSGLSSDDVADEVQTAAESALEKLAGLSAVGNPDLEVNIKSIYAQAYLSLYYAEKIRAATAMAAERNEDARTALAKAEEHWMDYTRIMDEMFIGADMLRTRSFEDWHVHDDAVSREYSALSGDAN
ncbi:MAG: hypothetical protein HN341_19230, partial [Verrucomicrobia bacterium]|nr:hypothetical protein [Verrucomicrobiota bacterium]